jgi:prepilin-type N-terminal cleavage/methylation domain-containing protein/prepilin-type processing-associated H-X9-DG protein
MRCERGFTLVEVLVVLGIIAVLLSITIPVVSSVRSSARITQCASNLRELGVGLISYASQSNSSFPVNSAAAGQFWYLKDTIGPFLTAPQVVGRSGEIPAGSSDAVGLAGGVFQCPNDLADSVRSYSMNIHASGDVSPGVHKVFDAPNPPGTLFKFGKGKESSKLLLLAESWSELPVKGSNPPVHVAQAILGFRNTPGERFGGNGGMIWKTPPDATPNRFQPRKTQIDFSRHRPMSLRSKPQEDPTGRANFLLVDGHVSLLSQSDLLNGKQSRSSYEVMWCPQDREIESRMMGDGK